MARAIVTLRVMPTSPDVDLVKLENDVKQKIYKFAGQTETRTTVEPIAFGLKSVNIIFVMEESQGTTDPLEKDISTLEDVNSVEVIDVRRAIG
ncbi:MAG: elongation factor 1-beta [Candidatus Woesearchaeota archaeon]